MTGRGVRVRIYCDVGDRAGHQPLSAAVVRLLWDEHAAGVTVIHGQEGFGAGRTFHSVHQVDVGSNHPIVVEWLDTPERFALLWPKLEALLAGRALVTREEVDVLVSPQHPLRRLPDTITVAEVMRSDVVGVAPNTSIADVVERMLAQDLRFVPVLDGDRLVGVISNGDLVERAGLALRLELQNVMGTAPALQERTAAEVMTHDPTTIEPGATLADAARTMLDRRLKRLPVIDRGRFVGLVSRVDLLRAVSDLGSSGERTETERTGTTVGEVMSTDVPTVRTGTPVAEVLDAVVSTRLNRAVVVDEDRHVVGIVTDAELLRRVGSPEPGLLDRLMRRGAARDPQELAGLRGKTAADIMLTSVVLLTREMPLRQAVEAMSQGPRKLLAVVDDEGRLCGMIDRAIALRALLRRDG